MDYDECENATLNDCSMDATCRDISGVGFNCTCNGGFVDLYPSSLPGRYCRAVPGMLNGLDDVVRGIVLNMNGALALGSGEGGKGEPLVFWWMRCKSTRSGK